MSNASCTCIIPAYNEEAKIVAVLQKILTIPQFDCIIIVDDGSTDHTKQYIQDFIKQHPQLHIQFLSHTDNKGKAAAVQYGAQHVKTEYVFLFDADLSNIHTDEVVQVIESIYKNPEIDMGILRRTNTRRHTKLFYRELILSGQRMLRTADLLGVFTKEVDRYQLEIAINMYMEERKKTIIRYPFSANNTFKHKKRGFRYGRKRDLSMFDDIISYKGMSIFLRHVFTFKVQAIHEYKKSKKIPV